TPSELQARSWHSHSLYNFPQNFIRRLFLRQGFIGKNNAMPQGIVQNLMHIIRGRIIAIGQEGRRSSRMRQGDRPPRRNADPDQVANVGTKAVGVTGCGNELEDVPLQEVRDPHLYQGRPGHLDFGWRKGWLRSPLTLPSPPETEGEGSSGG